MRHAGRAGRAGTRGRSPPPGWAERTAAGPDWGGPDRGGAGRRTSAGYTPAVAHQEAAQVVAASLRWPSRSGWK